MIHREFKHFHFCCGLGGGAAGFNDAVVTVGNVRAIWRCLGGLDIDAAGLRDFERLAGVPGTRMDLFTLEQYIDFHGQRPPPGWYEASPEDIRRAAGYETPDTVFISSPCKGASGLLSETMSQTPKYQALNALTLRCVWLMCEAWKDKPVKMIVFENVPRLATRGRHLLDQIGKLLAHYGYAVAETAHDCGELGGLAQSRRRFLLVARHVEQVPAFLYEPEKRNLRGVGEVLGCMPLAGDIEAAGPMHRVPALQWKTWVRLALVEAGKDWRSLERFAVEEGYLRDFAIMPECRSGYCGVRRWDEPTGTVAGDSLPSNGAFSVADPRFAQSSRWNDGQQYGVIPWNVPTGTISGQQAPAQGRFAVADVRHQGPAKHSNEFRIVPWDHAARTVSGAHGTGQCLADPRNQGGGFGNKYGVTRWDQPSSAVIGGSTTGQSAFALADPRYSNWQRTASTRKLGVVQWEGIAGTVTGSQQVASGALSIADPRPGLGHQQGDSLPAATDRLTCVIRSLDGTWHRPFTTLELAAIQSLFDPEDYWSADPQNAAELVQRDRAYRFELDGTNDSRHRERIGNAVPRKAAQAIAEVMSTTLLLAEAGETFVLSSLPVWVRPLAIAVNMARLENGVSQ